MSRVSFPTHEISIVVRGERLVGWSHYEINASMTEPDAHFSVSMPFEREVWDRCQKDFPITVMIDQTAVLTGFIDERLKPETDEVVEIVGRTKYGRMVQESAPSINFAGLSLFELVRAVGGEWYPTITFNNARNRRIVRGRGMKAKAGGEPLILKTRKAIGTRIEPGQSRAQVIKDLCAQAGFLVWVSGDGTELIVGEPNYEQEIQFSFFHPKSGSTRGDESTVNGMGVRESTADRYSRIIVVGSGTGTEVNYGASVANRYAEAKNNPSTPEGDGLDFTAPKRLIAVRSVQSVEEAQELANREMAKRDVDASRITVVAPGHGQVVGGVQTTIFAPDTLALCEEESTGTKGTYLITSCTYRCHREGGEETSMQLVRKGSVLVA